MEFMKIRGKNKKEEQSKISNYMSIRNIHQYKTFVSDNIKNIIFRSFETVKDRGKCSSINCFKFVL